LALIGGVFAIFFTSDIVSIPSIIGFITLFGIATRNGILLISRYQHLSEPRFSQDLQDAQDYSGQRNPVNLNKIPVQDVIVNGSIDRLNPILMTAISSALALIPLVFQGDRAGNEIQSPMAVVVLGGLLTSTLLNIYIVPVVYEIIQKRKKNRE
jgi:Cu/Ag efflux pump CusA